MAEDDKPFLCYQPGCGMRFINEDHLSVHMKKHDMSLALNLGVMPGGLSPMGICDQTPTPTKFLRNCEELGLFQELSKNPFDDSFKKALDPMDEPDSSDIPVSHAMLSLDTPLPSSVPQIIIDNPEEDGNISPTKNRDNTLSSIVPKKREKFLSSQALPTSTTSDDEDELPTASDADTNLRSVEEMLEEEDPVEEILGDNSDDVVASTSDKLETFTAVPVAPQPVKTVVKTKSKPMVVPSQVTMQALLQLPNGQTIPVQLPGSVVNQPQVVPVPTVAHVPVVTQNTVPVNVQGTTQYIQTVPTNIIHQKQVLPGNVTGLVQTSTPKRTLPFQTVKLGPSPLANTSVPTGNHPVITTVISPDKQTDTLNQGIKTVIAPKQIVVQSAQKRTMIPHQTQTQSTSKTSPVQGSQTYTKQRLKAALQQNITPSSSMKINHIFKIVEEVKQEQQQSQNFTSVASTSDTSSSPDSTPVPIKQIKLEVEEDTEDKRKKFLERNRAAAARCRQKRKSWIYNLESKAEELGSMNNKLQGEIRSLRGEVAHLKKLLIAHKDCPVTLQQQSQGQLLPQITSMETVSQEVLPLEDSQSSDISDLEPINILTTNGDVNSSSAVVPDVITVDTSVPGNTDIPMATTVITGPNSMTMIPTIVNLDFFTKKEAPS